MAEQPKDVTDPGFAPTDTTDNRNPYDWRTRWEPEARKRIKREMVYLIVLFFLVPGVLMVVGSRVLEGRVNLSEGLYEVFERFTFAWFGGLLGGVVFGMKWLYHAAAKGSWNEDRLFWRILVPHVSSAFAFIFVVLVSSGFITMFNADAFTSPMINLGVGFLAGYFSDNVLAKFAEVAEVLFGAPIRGKDDKKR